MSHLRQLLGGGIGSRPYRLTVPTEVDVTSLRDRLRRGDLGGAAAQYGGSLLPESEAPFAGDHRHVVDVALRSSLLAGGAVDDLLRFAAIHPGDEAVLEAAVARSGRDGLRRHEATALLDLARRS